MCKFNYDLGEIASPPAEMQCFSKRHNKGHPRDNFSYPVTLPGIGEAKTDLGLNLLPTSCIWQLQFFLFQFQFLLIFKILISEMYAIIVLQCLAIYLCLLLYATLILSYRSYRQEPSGLLFRCQCWSQAIKLRHFPSHLRKTLKWAEHLGRLTFGKEAAEIGSVWLLKERHKLGRSRIWERQGQQRHCSVFLLKRTRFSQGSQGEKKKITLND
jgi:hypothetical protein